MQPQGEVTNDEFRDTIRMLSQVVTNQVCQSKGYRQGGDYTLRIQEFIRVNPLGFTGSSTTEDLEKFTEEPNKVSEVMHVTNTERFELATYQLKGISKTWFD